MQLVAPIDIEDALRIDLAAIDEGVRYFAPPAPDDLTANSVQIMSVGGAAQTDVSNEHDVRVDCWAATDAAAVALADKVAGIIATLPLRDTARAYNTAEINALPYINPDPNRPTLPRASFRAVIGVRGTTIF